MKTLDLTELVKTTRAELECFPDDNPQRLIDREVTRALESVDTKGCLRILLAGELPCAEAVNRIIPASTFLSPTYGEAVKAAAWVLLTDYLDTQLMVKK